MPYQIAGIDVHKKMLAVAVADVEVDGDFHFERQKVGTTPADLRGLADWLVETRSRKSSWNRPRNTGGRGCSMEPEEVRRGSRGMIGRDCRPWLIRAA
jgi:hypothetical protein